MADQAMADQAIEYPPDTRGLNFFALDRNVQRLLVRRAPALMARFGDSLRDFGAWVGGPLDAQASYTDRYAPPRLETHDREGNRVGRVILNPSYEACHQQVYQRGAIGLAYGPEPAPHALSFAMGYLLSQADVSIHCPVTMTGAVAWVLDRLAPGPVRDRALPELVRMDGRTVTGATWATEVHGGSDVGATTTQAVPDGAGWRLHGLKWFASNATAGLALATARPLGAEPGGRGLGCYLVPATLEDGTPNRYAVRRLKDKIGTRGLATGEIDLDGALAIEVAPPPLGLKCMMEALEYSRIHNAVAAAGIERRAFLESMAWASHRQAFGRALRHYPMVQETLLDRMTELEADTALAFEAALAFDAARVDESRRDWLRVATALAKYRTAEQAVRAAARAVELVGGNGYTEEYATARLYRDSLVTAVWEGPANIQALELLRLVTGKRPGDRLFLERVESAPDSLPEAAGPLRVLVEECRAALAYVRRCPEDGPRHGRRLLDLMADTLGAALLCEEAACDRRKALVARRFLARRRQGVPVIGAAVDAAQDQFDAMVGYGVP